MDKLNPLELLKLIDKFSTVARIMSALPAVDADKDGIKDIDEYKALAQDLKDDCMNLRQTCDKIIELANADGRLIGDLLEGKQ